MNVLVVDDQRLSRAGIIKMIQWDRLGLRLAGECANGFDALEKMSDLEVDIVITDVRMPVLNGLELIEQAKELYTHMAFLVISGFDDFAYVRKSIQLSVTDYLLKPVEKGDLNEVLEKLIAKTQEGRQRAASQLQKTRAQFFYRLLEGAYNQSSQLLMDWEDIRLSEQEDHFIAVMFDSDSDMADINEPFGLVSDRCATFLIRMRGNTFTLIVAGAEDVMKSVSDELRTALRNRDLFHYAGIGPLVSGIEQLGESASKAFDAYRLQASLPDTAGQQASPSHTAEYVQSASLSLNNAWEREWFVLIKKGKQGDILNKLEELHGTLDAQSINPDDPDVMESIYPYVLLRGSRTLYESGSMSEIVYLEAFQIAKKLPFIVGLDTKRHIVADYFIRCRETEPLLSAQKAKEAVERAKAFIDAHFHQSINITDLAQSYYMNPGYFSTLFRQYTGSNFLEYITQLRMNHAKALIEGNPSQKIGDIAVLCGYQDLKHFRKLFKRYTGITPLQYKEDAKID